MHSLWRGRHFVLFGHQGNGGSKAALSGFSLFGLAVAKRRRALQSFVFGLRYGSVSPRSSSDWASRSSPRLSSPHESHTAAGSHAVAHTHPFVTGSSGVARRNEARRARLPREASPAKVAKDDQDKNDDDDDPKPGHVILSLGRADSTTSQAVCATCAAHAASETARRSGNRAGGAAGRCEARGASLKDSLGLPCPRPGRPGEAQRNALRTAAREGPAFWEARVPMSVESLRVERGRTATFQPGRQIGPWRRSRCGAVRGAGCPAGLRADWPP